MGDFKMVNVPEMFGSMVFNDKTMKERLPKAKIGRASCRERV